MPPEMMEEVVVDQSVDTGSDSSATDDSTGVGSVDGKQSADDPYSSKSSREYTNWLKGLRDSGDPLSAKFARLAKDNHGQMFELKKDFPTGINGIREMKTALDSVIYQDAERGELKGADAISALQDQARTYAELDEMVAAGDPAALETFDDAMKAGIVKMAPAILDMARTMDPAGYASAVLPHFVEQLRSSELVSNFNSMVDVLNQQPPSYLRPEQKAEWINDKMNQIVKLATGMGGWLNAQATKAGEAPKGPQPGAKGAPPASEQEAWRQEQQNHHWNTSIAPKLDEHAGKSFTQHFNQYAKRLNLDQPTTNALKMEFSKRVASQAAKDSGYMNQLKRYRAMKNPDPATVVNFTKVNFDKHAKNEMDKLVNERYKPFLNGKPRGAQPGNTNAAIKGPTPGPGIQIVSARPAEGSYDPKSRTLDEIHAKIYRLNNGKKVQFRSN